MVRLGILAMLCPLMLSACGESSPRGYAGSASSDTLKPVAAPPGADDQPTLAGQTGTQKTPDGLPALTAKGTNTNLFSTEISSEVDRMDRLENAVQELRNDFDNMAPAIVRLVSIEKDLQNLIGQLDMLTGGGAAAPIPPIEESALDVAEPLQPAAVPLPAPPAGIAADEDAMAAPQFPQPTPPAQESPAVPAPAAASTPPEATAPPVPLAPAAPAPAPATSATGVTVTGMRVGEHPGKIRIVLDVKGKTSFTADLDNAEKILVVELPQAGWSAESQKTFPASHPLLSSYRTEKLGDNGTLLILQLKTVSSVAYNAAMDDPATGSSKVVIDLTTK